MDYSDISFPGFDGSLTLYARDYGVPQGANPLTVLCLHGLTRNSADFHSIAMHLRDRYRVIVADQRGRGLSGWDANPANYTPAVYSQDMIGLLDHLAIDRTAIIGTSMGGLMAMILGVTNRNRIAGAVINDVGPEIAPAGLARIASYTGKTRPAANWTEAAELARFTNGVAFPDYGADDWMAFARRLYIADGQIGGQIGGRTGGQTGEEAGMPVLAYDPGIAKGLEKTSDVPVIPPDLWPLWDGLKGLPLLAIRGALSDLLTEATFEAMAARHEGLTCVTVPGRGHAPMLDEAAAVAAIDTFLAGLA